ncbi:MAG TPA: hypothetical protein PLB90_13695 [Opitutaceae bacterium]|nr:hypothetical protein [Opitutaceae bacterium]
MAPPFRPPVSHRLKVVAVLFAWLLATGVQWDLVQTAGWSRMFFRYAESMSYVQAAKRTFDGEMCGVCKAVNQAKQQQDAAMPQDGSKAKLVMICPPSPRFVFSAPECAPWSLSDRNPLSADRPVPPTPPPRTA